MTSGATRHITAPTHFGEWLTRIILRTFYWLSIRMIMGPPWPIWFQRGMLSLLAMSIPAGRGVVLTSRSVGEILVEIVTPNELRNPSVLLYLHGGAFMLGSPATHRPITTRLATLTGSCLWVPHYRRAPEHRYPVALDDCIACYQAILDTGVPAERIVVAGDSAGGSLALALSLKLRALGLPQPAGLLLISPVTDTDLTKDSCRRFRHSDPMLRLSLLRDCFSSYGLPPSGSEHHVLQHDLSGMPPLLIHVGSDEVLLDDSILLAAHARACDVAVDLDIHEGLWHVLHLAAPFLPSTQQALERLAQRFTELTQPGR